MAGEGEGGAGGAGAAGDGGKTGGEGGGASWRDSLPDDLKTAAPLAKFTDIPSLARSYTQLEHRFHESGRKDAIIKPGENATPEDWTAFHAKGGRPESADKYDIKVPDDVKAKITVTDDFVKNFKERAFNAGLTPLQAGTLFGTVLEANVSMKEQLDAKKLTARGEAKAALQKAWGEAFPAKLENINRMVEKFAEDADVPQLKEIANDERFARFLDKIAAQFGEDTLLDVKGSKSGGGSVNDLRGELRTVVANKAYRDVTSADHVRLQARGKELSRKIADMQTAGAR